MSKHPHILDLTNPTNHLTPIYVRNLKIGLYLQKDALLYKIEQIETQGEAITLHVSAGRMKKTLTYQSSEMVNIWG